MHWKQPSADADTMVTWSDALSLVEPASAENVVTFRSISSNAAIDEDREACIGMVLEKASNEIEPIETVTALRPD